MNRKTTGISQEQVEAQMQLCAQIQAYWHSRGRTPVAYVETYGCQQNEADSNGSAECCPRAAMASARDPKGRMWWS